MKNLSLIVWLSQLALSVVVPPVCLIGLGIWLRSLGWGTWVVIVAAVLGIVFAVDGLRYSLKLMNRQAKDETEDNPGLSFNEHE